ncbi:hypothetical protein FRC08_005271 [Ceratobasidium sp. 394]|nr:hypothetical protein FRC08_005271 [Ceratobasidium sp. 394]KAG9079607.1 hypothetical protein FS749_008376 [Ceratobasidium sp. UAMH 11750]
MRLSITLLAIAGFVLQATALPPFECTPTPTPVGTTPKLCPVGKKCICHPEIISCTCVKIPTPTIGDPTPTAK